MLTATGDGDESCDPAPILGTCVGDTPFGRRIGFQRRHRHEQQRFEQVRGALRIQGHVRVVRRRASL